MDNNNDSYSISDLLHLMWSKIWLFILLLIFCAGAAFGAAKFIMPLKYQSYTTMYVKNNNSPQSGESVNINDLNASKSLVGTYIAVLQSDSIMNEAGELLLNEFGADRVSKVFSVSDGRVSASSLRSALVMSAVNDTEVLKITAVTTDAELSAALCRTLSRLAPEFLIRVVGAGSVETIDEAQPSYAAVSPNIPKTTAIGGIMGIVLAAVIIILMDFFDNSAKSSDKLSNKYKKAILGEVMTVGNPGKKKSTGDSKPILITDKETPFYVTESYKAMRTNLIFSLSTSDKRIFAVSSAMPGEGKSTTASNIAIALSQLDNNRVLLIDADMRKPIQHKIFKLKNNVGLSSLLGKMSKNEQCIKKSAAENLDVITAGPQPPNPSELLSSEQMKKTLTELSERYDYIIIDMPPVNVVSDPLSISRLIAGLVVVVRYGVTSFSDIDELVKKSELSDMKLLGFVMNDIKQKSHKDSYYRKRYNYDYSSGYGGGESANDKKAKK